MVDYVVAEYANDVVMKVHCTPDFAQLMDEEFSFYVPNYMHMPKYKNGMWDGRIRLYNKWNKELYTGLIFRLKKLCKKYEYDLHLEGDWPGFDKSITDEYIQSLTDNDNSVYSFRDYQALAVKSALTYKRCILLSPTSSGKSFMVYGVALAKVNPNYKMLLMVPTISLVKQMKSDIEGYGDRDFNIQTIMEGSSKDIDPDAEIVISTWQSVYRQPAKWFETFKIVMGDEAHTFKIKGSGGGKTKKGRERESDVLANIMKKIKNCEYRIGLTGTIDDTESPINSIVLEGLFGPVLKATTTKEMIERGEASPLKIICVVFDYPEEIRKKLAAKPKKVEGQKTKTPYQREIETIISFNKRNKAVSKIVNKLKGNTLSLFQFVDKHGIPLYEEIAKGDKPAHLIHGGIKSDEREAIRKSVMKSDENNIVASYQTYSTGINIPNLDNLALTFPTKAKVRILQSIGRVLRKSKEKEIATVVDFADDISWKSSQNHTLKSFKKRLKLYMEEGFEFEIIKIKL